MYRVVKFALIFTVCAVITIPATADESFRFNFQGRLRNAAGDLVPDGNYPMTFYIYSDSVGGDVLWGEMHSAVPVQNGLFSLDLGSINPCSLNVNASPNIYLAAQVGTEPPMARRMRIAASPHSAIARRLYGDLQTSGGSLVITNPQNANQKINLNTGSDNMGLVIEERELMTGNLRRLYAGTDSDRVAINFDGPNDKRLFEAQATSGPLGKVSWKMFNPQPEPPGSDPLRSIEISTNSGGEGSLVMFNPQPEPPGNDPLLGLRTNLGGAHFEMFAPNAVGTVLVNRHPQIRLNCDSLSSKFLLQRARTSTGGDDSTGILMRSDSSIYQMEFYAGNSVHLRIASATGGASMKFFSDGSEFMGIEPVPWRTGGDLTMRSQTGAITMIVSSEGQLSIGTNSTSNILTVKQYSATDPIADAWTTYSSRRWKTNIEPIRGALDKVKRLRGVSFDWRETGHHDIGLIAEEVGQIVPEVVAYEENGVDARSVDYARLTALLIEAVKEQQEEINQLKSEISELKAYRSNRASKESK